MYSKEKRIGRVIFGLLMALIMVMATVTLPVFNTLSFADTSDSPTTKKEQVTSTVSNLSSSEGTQSTDSLPKPKPKINANARDGFLSVTSWSATQLGGVEDVKMTTAIAFTFADLPAGYFIHAIHPDNLFVERDSDSSSDQIGSWAHPGIKGCLAFEILSWNTVIINVEKSAENVWEYICTQTANENTRNTYMARFYNDRTLTLGFQNLPEVYVYGNKEVRFYGNTLTYSVDEERDIFSPENDTTTSFSIKFNKKITALTRGSFSMRVLSNHPSLPPPLLEVAYLQSKVDQMLGSCTIVKINDYTWRVYYTNTLESSIGIALMVSITNNLGFFLKNNTGIHFAHKSFSSPMLMKAKAITAAGTEMTNAIEVRFNNAYIPFFLNYVDFDLGNPSYEYTSTSATYISDLVGKFVVESQSVIDTYIESISKVTVKVETGTTFGLSMKETVFTLSIVPKQSGELTIKPNALFGSLVTFPGELNVFMETVIQCYMKDQFSTIPEQKVRISKPTFPLVTVTQEGGIKDRFNTNTTYLHINLSQEMPGWTYNSGSYVFDKYFLFSTNGGITYVQLRELCQTDTQNIAFTYNASAKRVTVRIYNSLYPFPQHENKLLFKFSDELTDTPNKLIYTTVPVEFTYYYAVPGYTDKIDLYNLQPAFSADYSWFYNTAEGIYYVLDDVEVVNTNPTGKYNGNRIVVLNSTKTYNLSGREITPKENIKIQLENVAFYKANVPLIDVKTDYDVGGPNPNIYNVNVSVVLVGSNDILMENSTRPAINVIKESTLNIYGTGSLSIMGSAPVGIGIVHDEGGIVNIDGGTLTINLASPTNHGAPCIGNADFENGINQYSDPSYKLSAVNINGGTVNLYQTNSLSPLIGGEYKNYDYGTEITTKDVKDVININGATISCYPTPSSISPFNAPYALFGTRNQAAGLPVQLTFKGGTTVVYNDSYKEIHNFIYVPTGASVVVDKGSLSVPSNLYEISNNDLFINSQGQRLVPAQIPLHASPGSYSQIITAITVGGVNYSGKDIIAHPYLETSEYLDGITLFLPKSDSRKYLFELKPQTGNVIKFYASITYEVFGAWKLSKGLAESGMPAFQDVNFSLSTDDPSTQITLKFSNAINVGNGPMKRSFHEWAEMFDVVSSDGAIVNFSNAGLPSIEAQVGTLTFPITVVRPGTISLVLKNKGISYYNYANTVASVILNEPLVNYTATQIGGIINEKETTGIALTFDRHIYNLPMAKISLDPIMNGITAVYPSGGAIPNPVWIIESEANNQGTGAVKINPFTDNTKDLMFNVSQFEVFARDWVDYTLSANGDANGNPTTRITVTFDKEILNFNNYDVELLKSNPQGGTAVVEFIRVRDVIRNTSDPKIWYLDLSHDIRNTEGSIYVSISCVWFKRVLPANVVKPIRFFDKIELISDSIEPFTESDTGTTYIDIRLKSGDITANNSMFDTLTIGSFKISPVAGFAYVTNIAIAYLSATDEMQIKLFTQVISEGSIRVEWAFEELTHYKVVGLHYKHVKVYLSNTQGYGDENIDLSEMHPKKFGKDSVSGEIIWVFRDRVYFIYKQDNLVKIYATNDNYLDTRIEIEENAKVELKLTNIKMDDYNSQSAIKVNTGADLKIISSGTNNIVGSNISAIDIKEHSTVTFVKDDSNPVSILNVTVNTMSKNVIGNAYEDKKSGKIIINSGTITAMILSATLSNGVAIGSMGEAEDITINGGFVYATGGGLGVGIGTYSTRNTDHITINGGMVIARGNYGINAFQGDLYINGGSVRSENYLLTTSLGTQPFTSVRNVQVYLERIRIAGISQYTNKKIEAFNLASADYYGLNDVYTDQTEDVYFYLPRTTLTDYTITTNSEEFTITNGINSVNTNTATAKIYVEYTVAQQGGISGKQQTTSIAFAFSKPISSNVTVDNLKAVLTVTARTGSIGTGVFTRTNTNNSELWTLSVLSPVVEGDIQLALAGVNKYTFLNPTKIVTVYARTPLAVVRVEGNGTIDSVDTTYIEIEFDKQVNNLTDSAVILTKHNLGNTEFSSWYPYNPDATGYSNTWRIDISYPERGTIDVSVASFAQYDVGANSVTLNVFEEIGGTMIDLENPLSNKRLGSVSLGSPVVRRYDRINHVFYVEGNATIYVSGSASNVLNRIVVSTNASINLNIAGHITNISYMKPALTVCTGASLTMTAIDRDVIIRGGVDAPAIDAQNANINIVDIGKNISINAGYNYSNAIESLGNITIDRNEDYTVYNPLLFKTVKIEGNVINNSLYVSDTSLEINGDVTSTNVTNINSGNVIITGNLNSGTFNYFDYADINVGGTVFPRPLITVGALAKPVYLIKTTMRHTFAVNTSLTALNEMSKNPRIRISHYNTPLHLWLPTTTTREMVATFSAFANGDFLLRNDLTINANDDNEIILYDKTLTFTAGALGGDDTIETSGIAVTFNKPIISLLPSQVTLNAISATYEQFTIVKETDTKFRIMFAGGSVSGGALTVNITGIIDAPVGPFSINTTSEVFNIYSPRSLYFSAVQVGGAVDRHKTNAIDITFSGEPTELQSQTGVDSLPITVYDGNHQDTSLTGRAVVISRQAMSSNRVRMLIEEPSYEGIVFIGITTFGGYRILSGLQQVSIHIKPQLTWSAVADDGVQDRVDTTKIRIDFNKAVTLNYSQVTVETIAGDSGRAIKTNITGSGKLYYIYISDVTQGKVRLSITNFDSAYLSQNFLDVDVYAATPVTWSAIQQGGVYNESDTTSIAITFSNPLNLDVSKVNLTSIVGNATISGASQVYGTNPATATVWAIQLTNVVQGRIRLSISNFDIYNFKNVYVEFELYTRTQVTLLSVTQIGGMSDGSKATTGISIKFNVGINDPFLTLGSVVFSGLNPQILRLEQKDAFATEYIIHLRENYMSTGILGVAITDFERYHFLNSLNVNIFGKVGDHTINLSDENHANQGTGWTLIDRSVFKIEQGANVLVSGSNANTGFTLEFMSTPSSLTTYVDFNSVDFVRGNKDIIQLNTGSSVIISLNGSNNISAPVGYNGIKLNSQSQLTLMGNNSFEITTMNKDAISGNGDLTLINGVNLRVQTGSDGAGIAVNKLTIENASVFAQSSGDNPGIGSSTLINEINDMTINIYAPATVSALGSGLGAGIGGSGGNRSNIDINIFGGNIRAESSDELVPDIGQGGNHISGNVATKILGGTVKTLHKNIYPRATNADNKPLYLSSLRLGAPGLAHTLILGKSMRNSAPYYNVTGVYSDEIGYVYFYLPLINQEEIIKVDIENGDTFENKMTRPTDDAFTETLYIMITFDAIQVGGIQYMQDTESITIKLNKPLPGATPDVIGRSCILEQPVTGPKFQYNPSAFVKIDDYTWNVPISNSIEKTIKVVFKYIEEVAGNYNMYDKVKNLDIHQVVTTSQIIDVSNNISNVRRGPGWYRDTADSTDIMIDTSLGMSIDEHIDLEITGTTKKNYVFRFLSNTSDKMKITLNNLNMVTANAIHENFLFTQSNQNMDMVIKNSNIINGIGMDRRAGNVVLNIMRYTETNSLTILPVGAFYAGINVSKNSTLNLIDANINIHDGAIPIAGQGTINIHGGDIELVAPYGAPAIENIKLVPSYDLSEDMDSGITNISGGSVKMVGGINAPAFGASNSIFADGQSRVLQELNISGYPYVEMLGGMSANAVGNNEELYRLFVNINSGSVVAKKGLGGLYDIGSSYNLNADIIIKGGNINAKEINPVPYKYNNVTGEKETLYLTELTVIEQELKLRNNIINGGSFPFTTYNIRKTELFNEKGKTIKNKAYVYLPMTTQSSLITLDLDLSGVEDSYVNYTIINQNNVNKVDLKPVNSIISGSSIDGALDKSDTTKIRITFEKKVETLSIANLKIQNIDGIAVPNGKISTSDGGYTYDIGVTVTHQGQINITIVDLPNYIVGNNQTIPVYTKKEITFTAKADGKAKKTTSKVITLTFSSDITGLTIKNIKVAKGTGNATISKITGKGKVWKITIKKVTKEGKIKLTIPSFGTYNVKTGTLQVGVYKKK